MSSLWQWVVKSSLWQSLSVWSVAVTQCFSHSMFNQFCYTFQITISCLQYFFFTFLPCITPRLYKERRDMHYNTLSSHSLTYSLTHFVFKMSHYPIPAWDERPFCDCGKPTKLRISLEEATYGRRYWVCPDDDEWFEVSLFYITVARIYQWNCN